MGDVEEAEYIEVYLEVARQGLETGRSRVQPNLQRLRQRLGLAKNVRLGGQLVAALTSAGLIAAALAAWGRDATIAIAVTNFAGISCSLFAGHLETPLHGGSGNLVELFETLVKLDVEAEQLAQDLLVLQRADADEARSLEMVALANGIAAKLRSAERMLWGAVVSQPG